MEWVRAADRTPGAESPLTAWAEARLRGPAQLTLSPASPSDSPDTPLDPAAQPANPGLSPVPQCPPTGSTCSPPPGRTPGGTPWLTVVTTPRGHAHTRAVSVCTGLTTRRVGGGQLRELPGGGLRGEKSPHAGRRPRGVGPRSTTFTYSRTTRPRWVRNDQPTGGRPRLPLTHCPMHAADVTSRSNTAGPSPSACGPAQTRQSLQPPPRGQAGQWGARRSDQMSDVCVGNGQRAGSLSLPSGRKQGADGMQLCPAVPRQPPAAGCSTGPGTPRCSVRAPGRP